MATSDSSTISWWAVPLRLLAGLGLAALTLWLLLPTQHLHLIATHLQTDAIRQELLLQLAGFGLVLLTGWGILALVIARLRQQKRVRTLRVITQAQGTAMVEFLVILPVLILLIFGLVQLAMNLIGGTLFQVARYEATRAARVWAPELEADRGANTDMVNRRIRTAVASVMAPVAPSGGSNPNIGDAMKFRHIMVRRYLPVSESFVGLEESAMEGREADLLANALSTNEESVASALGKDLFPLRAYHKFNNAYHATTQASFQHDGDRIRASFTYKHQQMVPAVAWVFGQPETVDQRGGYFLSWSGDLPLRAQRHPPNATLPTERSACEGGDDIGC